MMAIETIGGVYCPLSPRDPSHRLHELVTTNSKSSYSYSFSHEELNSMKTLFHLILIQYWFNNDVEIDVDIDHSLIIFTSGISHS